MGRLVFTLTRKEFMVLNNFVNEPLVIKRKLGKKFFYNKTAPIDIYIVVKKGKDNILLFEKTIANTNVDELKEKKVSELEFERAEFYEINGYIIGTAKIVDFNVDTSEITINELNILAEPLTLKSVGLKRIPSVYSIIKESEND